MRLEKLDLANITIFRVHFSITNYAALSKWMASLTWMLSLPAVAPPLSWNSRFKWIVGGVYLVAILSTWFCLTSTLINTE